MQLLASIGASCGCLGCDCDFFNSVSFAFQQRFLSVDHAIRSVPTMLRLGLSRIQLEKKDLDYHKGTHQRRQDIRLHGHPVSAPTSASKQAHKRNKSSKSSVPRSLKKESSASPVKLLSSEQNQEDTLISRDPVPRGSRAFWDRVLAEAGTPTRTRSTESGNGRIFDPSDEWIESNRSTRASIEEVTSPHLDTERDRTSIDTTRVLAPTTYNPSSSGSSNSTYTLGYSVPNNSINTSTESIQQTSSRNRFSNLFRWKAKPATNIDGGQLNESTDVGLDGHSSDVRRSHEREKSDATEASQGNLLRDGLYGSRRDRRTISTSLDNTKVDYDTENPDPHPKGSWPDQLSPPTVSLPLLTDSLRRPSGTLPRSPLYISQAVPSSSPEKGHDASSRGPNMPMAASPSLLSLPPRRRRTYRPRSETYSFEISVGSSSSVAQISTHASSAEFNVPRPLDSLSSPLLASISNGSPQNPNLIAHAGHRQSSTSFLNTSLSVTPLLPSMSRFSSRSSSCIELPGNPFNLSHSGRTSTSSSHMRYLPPAPRSSPQSLSELETHQTAHNGAYASNAGSLSTSSARNLSPHALPFIPRNPRARNLTPQYPLPPPFGATARTVSYSRTMPTSASFSTPPSIPQVSPRTPSPRQRSTIGLNPNSPTRSAFSIYNDSQPPNTQPQTPADLPRRPPFNPFNAAPPQLRSSYLPPPPAVDQTIAGGQTHVLPTRGRETPTRVQAGESPMRLEAMVSRGGENADTVTSEERERRRVWNVRIRIGREEQRRLERSPGLERGPGI